MSDCIAEQPLGFDSLSVLVVEDDLLIQRFVEALLQAEGCRQVQLCTSAEQALDWLGLDGEGGGVRDLDVVLMDINLPGMDGFELTQRIKARPEYHDLPIAFTTASNDDAYLERAFAIGASDFITKPVRRIELLARVRTLAKQRRLAQALRHLAYYDALTGLPNRTLLRDRFEQLAARAERNQSSFALLFMDLDRFKSINDSLGHDVGDQALCLLSEQLAARLRRSDTLARIGGDEFVVLVDEVAEVEEVTRLAGDLLDAVAQPLLLGERTWCLGASIGIALYPYDGEGYDELMGAADRSMYLAKERRLGSYCLSSGECGGGPLNEPGEGIEFGG